MKQHCPAARAILLASPVLAAVLAGCSMPPGYLRDAPKDFAFHPTRERIPGSLVESGPVRLDVRGRKRVLVRAEGAAEHLIINGVPAGKVARVKPGSKIKVAVRAPDGYAETAVGSVRANGEVAEFSVTSLRKAPASKLQFGEAKAAPGRLATSRVVAPTGFESGTEIKVDAPGIKVETRQGQFDPPVALKPGEPFRLVTRVQQGTEADEPMEVKVTLGALSDVWRVSVP